MIAQETPITPEQFAEAVETLKHQQSFKVFTQWLEELKEAQTVLVAQGGTDPYRQYLESGVLQGFMRIQQSLDNAE